MRVQNAAGHSFDLRVSRTVRLLDLEAIQNLFGAPSLALDGLDWVAFETVNQITNVGSTPWTRETGAPSIWILAMFNPSPDTWAIIPFRRLIVSPDGHLLFRCDGQLRSKIGIAPGRVLPFAGSYSASRNLLTLVHFDRPPGATEYVNSAWELQEHPFAGDVVNSYNDGPVEPGKAALGGFYELETSSPAAFLDPGAALVHTHRTLHLVGPTLTLSGVAERSLGIPLDRAMAMADPP
jgi:hypothetical protein